MNLVVRNGLVGVEVPDPILREMESEYARMYPDQPVLNAHTLVKSPENRKAGILGELVFSKLYPECQKPEDLRWDFTVSGKRVDVKCKLRNVDPDLSKHQASVYLYQTTNRMVDLYYFMSTVPTFRVIWLCGYISRQELLSHPKRRVWNKGDVSPSNGMVYKDNTVDIDYQHIKRVDINKLVENSLKIGIENA